VKRSTLLITGVLVAVLSVFSLGLSETPLPPTDPPPAPESSDGSEEAPTPPDEEEDEGFGVRCC
jgi:hypothetical protein